MGFFRLSNCVTIVPNFWQFYKLDTHSLGSYIITPMSYSCNCVLFDFKPFHFTTIWEYLVQSLLHTISFSWPYFSWNVNKKAHVQHNKNPYLKKNESKFIFSVSVFAANQFLFNPFGIYISFFVCVASLVLLLTANHCDI